jgi:hypothetical protein
LFQPQGDGEILEAFEINDLAREKASFEDLVAF